MGSPSRRPSLTASGSASAAHATAAEATQAYFLAREGLLVTSSRDCDASVVKIGVHHFASCHMPLQQQHQMATPQVAVLPQMPACGATIHRVCVSGTLADLACSLHNPT